MGDDSTRNTGRPVLDPFPGETVLSHEGNIWMKSTITKLSPYELVIVAETSIPPAVSEIIDSDLDTFPELPANHPNAERRMETRIRIAKENRLNAERRRRITLRAWTTLFECLRTSCVPKAPHLADELYNACDLSTTRSDAAGFFDGPRAWRIILKRLQGADRERTEQDKNFYKTALEYQEKNRLANGATQAEFEKRAFAFVNHIMPNLAQKYTPEDAAEYVLKLMPPDLYEASQRVKYETKREGLFLDLPYLIRQCGSEVFRKQNGHAPKPAFISVEALGGHDISLLSTVIGTERQLQCECEKPGTGKFGGQAFMLAGGGEKGWCPKCPHPGGDCIANPDNVRSPPPSVYLDTKRWNGLMKLRDENAASRGLPKPQPVPKPSDEAIRRYKEILSKRKERRPVSSSRPGGGGSGGTPRARAAPAGIAGINTDLESFFANILDITDNPEFVGVAVDGPPGDESGNGAWLAITGAHSLAGVQPGREVTDAQISEIESAGGAIYEFDTRAEAERALADLGDLGGTSDDALSASEVANELHRAVQFNAAAAAVIAVPPPPSAVPPPPSPMLPPIASGLAPPTPSAVARFAAAGSELGPTPLPFEPLLDVAAPSPSPYSPYVPSRPSPPHPPPTHAPTTPYVPRAPTTQADGGRATSRKLSCGGGCATVRESRDESMSEPAPPPPPSATEPSVSLRRKRPSTGSGTLPTQYWTVSGVSPDEDGVRQTSSPLELVHIQHLGTVGNVTSYGFGESGEAAARERWERLQTSPAATVAPASRAAASPAVPVAPASPAATMAPATRAVHATAVGRNLGNDQRNTMVIALVLGLACWRLASIVVASTDFPIAAGLLAGAVPFYVKPEERRPLAICAINFVWGIITRLARVANEHGAITCTLIGLFFLARGESAPSRAGARTGVVDDSTEISDPHGAGAAGASVPGPPDGTIIPTGPVPTIAAFSSLPRADLLTEEQAGQLFIELLAGHETPGSLPKSITHCLAIADTGCATSMGNHEDQFHPGSLIESKSNVVGVSGPMTLDKRGDFRFPMMSTQHGIRKWEEPQGILNKRCPYVLLALGRASIRNGLAMYLPAWGADGNFSYPNGVKITLYNRNVLALRPLGYKPTPSAGLATSVQCLGVPASGNYVWFLGSGPRRDGDVQEQARLLGVTSSVVNLDIKIGGSNHDFTTRRFVDMVISATDNSGRARCVGAIESIRCATWSASLHLPDASGKPGNPPRSFPDFILGKPNARGDVPKAVSDANTESEHTVEINYAILRRGGFVMSEAPARRRPGSAHFEKHALNDCLDHAHMYDHPAWAKWSIDAGAVEVPWDQCMDAPEPRKTAVKSSIWKVTPNIGGAVKLVFGQQQCSHPPGTHIALRGTDEHGVYLTSSTKCENYHPDTCRRIARCIQIYLDSPTAARLPAPSGDVVEPAGAAPAHAEPDMRPPPEPSPDYESALAKGKFRIHALAAIIRGKHLPKSAICYEFLHRSFVHSEDRVLRHLPDSLCDADDTWLQAMRTYASKPPCEACITGEAPRIGASGSVPRDEGLIFLDVFHISVPCVFTGFRIVIGVTHAASKKRKTIRVKTKDQAHLAMEIILAYFNSVGKPVTWIHTDGANELKGSHMVPLCRSKNIRVTCTVKRTSRQNPQEPSWRAIMSGTRKTLRQSNLPVGFWGSAWDDTIEGQSLVPSRNAPHDCALGRLLSTPDKVVKPKGSHRRPFGSLCYPVVSERLPSGTLRNKAASQAKRCILLGYSGGRSGDFEALGVTRSQPGYVCYDPETNSTMVTDDVYICWRVQPGLERTSGGGWTIPSSKIPFSSDYELEREKERVAHEHSGGPEPQIPDAQHEDEPASMPTEIENDSQIPTADADFDPDRLTITPGYPEESDESALAPSRGGEPSDTPIADATGIDTPEPAVHHRHRSTRRFLIPRDHYPEYACDEHGGVGWEVTVVEKKGVWSRCRHVGASENGVAWEDVWRKTADLIDISTLKQSGGDASVDETPAELRPSVDTAPRVAEMQPVPTDVTGPAPGLDDPLREPRRPVRDRQPPDRYGNHAYATPALGSLRHVSEVARFESTSPRLSSEALAVTTELGTDRLLSRLDDLARDDGPPSLLLASVDDPVRELNSLRGTNDNAIRTYDHLDPRLQRAVMILTDHDEALCEFGPSSPETNLLREVYAAASVDAACAGLRAPPLDPLFVPISPQCLDPEDGVRLERMFDDKYSGTVFASTNYDCDPLIVAAAKTKSSPHIFSERQMRGARWDEPKQIEIAKMKRLNAKIDVTADDPKVRGMKPVETMWTGREKINVDGTWKSDHARCVARGDLHSKFYHVTPNQTMSPVVRTPSLNATDAVSCLRRQHTAPFDVPGAYLQGKQRGEEQIVCRAPPGFRDYDERGVEILWLMLNPLYGQADSGAIWNRTWNEFMTSPESCGYDRCAQEPCLYSKRLGDEHELGPDDSYITCPIYVDDGRLKYDPTAEAKAEAARDMKRMSEEFGIEFKAIDPKNDFFLGANRITSDDRSTCLLTARTYIVDMARRFFPDVDLTQSSAAFPASWSYTPADEALVQEWEAATAARAKAPDPLVSKYGSLYGACLHASKYRPEILAAMGLLGSCLTFPTERMYYCLVRVLVYLVRTKNLGITFSGNTATSHVLRARADSNWSEKRSTSGFVIFLADAAINTHSRRQHCITMSSCEAELVALADCAIELIHVDGTLEHIGYRRGGPIQVGTDNKGAFDLCHRFTSAQNSRHVDRKLFKMRELRGVGTVTVEHVPTENNPADLFTKILSRQVFERHRRTVLNLGAQSFVEPDSHASGRPTAGNAKTAARRKRPVC